MSEREEPRPDGYEPPQVENVPAEDGPAVTSAGKTKTGPEWRPGGDVEEGRE